MSALAVVFDTETTGLTLPSVADLNAQPRIIELGAALVDRDGKIFGELSKLINPGAQISAEITKITGITNDDLIGAPTFKEFFPQLRVFFEGAKYLVAHNAPFDCDMLRFDLQRSGFAEAFCWPPNIMCTVQEFYHIKSRRMKLTELYEHATGKQLAQTHRALDDVKALTEALTALKFWETL